MNSFELIGLGLAWFIGNSNRVRVSKDPCPRRGERHILPRPLIDFLKDRGISKLPHLVNSDNLTIWC